MMKLTMEVKVDDQKFTITTGNRDIIDCENEFGMGIDTRLTHLLFLAYKNLWRQRLITCSWDEFIDKDVEVEIVESGDAHPLDETAPSKTV